MCSTCVVGLPLSQCTFTGCVESANERAGHPPFDPCRCRNAPLPTVWRARVKEQASPSPFDPWFTPEQTKTFAAHFGTTACEASMNKIHLFIAKECYAKKKRNKPTRVSSPTTTTHQKHGAPQDDGPRDDAGRGRHACGAIVSQWLRQPNNKKLLQPARL